MTSGRRAAAKGSEIVIGQIGYGYWGPNLARNFASLDGVSLKYICDTSEDMLGQAKKNHPGVQLLTDTAKVIGDQEVDAVVVGSSAVTHYPLSRAALMAGKHVLVEKPLSLKPEQGEELVRLAAENGLVLMVGHLLMYHPCVTFMKSYLDSGQAGNVFYIYSQRLNLGRLRHDENCLWSLAPHDISVMLHLLGKEPLSVAARGATYLRENLQDIVFCTLYFPDGQMGNLHVSWLDPHKIRKFTIVGSEKMIVFDDMVPDDKVKIFDKKVYRDDGVLDYGKELYLHFGEEVMPSISMEEPLLVECRHFRDCVRGQAQPLSDGEQGLRVLKILDAATRSLAAGGSPIDL